MQDDQFYKWLKEVKKEYRKIGLNWITMRWLKESSDIWQEWYDKGLSPKMAVQAELEANF